MREIIPIDNAISDFKNHLLSHPRTILSAKYGDGKTYFLSKFVNSSKAKNRFEFLTLYPVNYQVLPNHDIFELIKRDILLQMLSKGMLNEYEIPDNVAAAFFLQNNFSTVTEAFLPFLQSLDSTSTVAKALITGLSTVKMFKTLREKYKDWKKKFSTAEAIEDYLVNNAKDIYETDAITEIIRSAIRIYKNGHSRKRVVLIIEDLDRIDPAHLFRLMNIFSAHMDYGYRIGVPVSNKYLVGNKFDLDNVVMVMDYDNTHNIFRHFYGEYANFKGYIDKFCSNNYFHYSLAEQKYNYMIKCAKEATNLPDKMITAFFTQDAVGIKSVRDISKCFVNIDSDIVVPDKPYKGFNSDLLKLIAIARRFGTEDEMLKKIINQVAVTNTNTFMKYAGAYLSILQNEGKLARFAIQSNDRYYVIDMPSLQKDGTLKFDSYEQQGVKPKTVDPSVLLNFIAK